MDIPTLAVIADLVAATAIVLTLVFLGYEMRQTRKQSELANWRDLLDSLVVYKGLTHDPELANLVERGHTDFAALGPEDRRRFGLFLEQGIHIYGNFLKHNDSLPRRLEGLDDAVQNYLVEMLTTPGGAAWWAETRALGHFMPETYRVVDRCLKRGHINTDR